MSATATALLGFAALYLLLALLVVSYRGIHVFFRGRPVNSFSPDAQGEDAFAQRMIRVHANCYENMPVWATVMLLAIATDHTDVTDPLAMWLLGARMAQAAVHLSSTSKAAVWVRFTFFGTQVAILGWWVLELARV